MTLNQIALFIPLAALLLLHACSAKQMATIPRSKCGLSGTTFFDSVKQMQWQQREEVAVPQLLDGNIPPFLRRFAKVKIAIKDSASGKKIKGAIWVSRDYLAIGQKNDWARVPLTPIAAQRVADAYNCFLPTRKLVDDIYHAARVKLTPVPMFAHRDSSVTMYQHHLIVEGQRKLRNGLISGIKKDVVISRQITRAAKPNRVAIYGWHKPDGKPIQPLYTGHVNWYVDYSHGIRLICKQIKVLGHKVEFSQVMAHPVYYRLLCDEPNCDFLRY
jgi:hypothetical protein